MHAAPAAFGAMQLGYAQTPLVGQVGIEARLQQGCPMLPHGRQIIPDADPWQLYGGLHELLPPQHGWLLPPQTVQVLSGIPVCGGQLLQT